MPEWLLLVGKLIETGEGFRSHPYQDFARRIWTQGFGATEDIHGTAIGPNSPPIDEQTARLWYQAKCRNLHAAILLHDASFGLLEEYEIAALIDWCYRFGAARLFGTTLWRYVLRGDMDLAAAEFPKWDHAEVNGEEIEVDGLKKRCAAEQEMFEGKYDLPAPSDS